MILVDANLLLYAYDTSAPAHQAAKIWWEDRLSQPEPVGLAWVTLLAFVRIGTNPRVFAKPLSLAEACAYVAAWLGRPMVRILQPGEHHWRILDDLLRRTQAAGNLVTDAHLAALALEHGARLLSTDQDFRRFDTLRWENPLVR